MKKILGEILIFVVFCATSAAQTCKFYSSDYDLSSSLVTCLYQDTEGIIWIGTEDGLNRFDGNDFRVYRHIPGDRNSLAHNYVRVIKEDKDGHLLVGTFSGVQEYIREKDLFTWTPYDSDMLPLRAMVRDILPRNGGDILISGEEFFTVRFRGPEDMMPGPAPLGLPDRQTSDLLEDTMHNLWILKSDDGAYRLDYDYMLQHRFVFDSTPTSICEVPGTGVFISTGATGLHKLDNGSDTFSKCDIPGLEGTYINGIEYLGDGRIHICTNDSGLLSWTPGEPDCEQVVQVGLPFPLEKSNVRCIIKDNADNLWVGIYGKGVVMIPDSPNSFRNISNRSFGGANVTALAVTTDNCLLVGTSNDGLYEVSLSNFSTRHFPRSNSQDGVGSQVNSILEDSKGRLWIGTFANGLGLFDRGTGRCTYIIRGCNISSIAEDFDGAILVASTTRSVFRYFPETKTLQNLTNLTDLVGHHVECLLKPDEKTMYLGSNRGAFGIIRSTGGQPPVSRQYLSKQIVYCVHKSGDNVFFGTAGGLTVLDERTGEIKSYTTVRGLPSNIIYGIAGDNDKGIWISTSNGLTRFDPKDETFENYFVGDGLQGNEFSKNVSCSSPQGYLYFAGNNGITYFNPDEINPPTNSWTAKCRLVQQDRNSFYIDLSTAEYNAPEGVRFEIRLDGDEWELLPSGNRHIEINSINRGRHRFDARVVDRDARSETTTVHFRVKPAGWLSIWALLLYVIIASSIIWFAISYYKLKVQAHEHLNQLKDIVGTSQEANLPVSRTLLTVDDPELLSPDDRLMQRVMKVLNENISNPELTVDFIAQEVGISRVHLYRKLKEITNQTSKEFVRNIRLAKAAEMLKQKKHSIAELSEAVGYNSPSAFSTAFKELYGVSPSEYAKKKDED